MIVRRTSFEALIGSFDADAPPKWPLKGKSLRYGQLQSAIEDCCKQPSAEQGLCDDKRSPAADPERFFIALAEEVRRVDRHFEQAALRLLQPYNWTTKLRLSALRVLRFHSAEERQREKTANEVHWCQQYAAINHIALQRLVEQYDRCFESKAGAKFLEDCWAPSTDFGLFLKTPLLDELHELKLMLLKSAHAVSPSSNGARPARELTQGSPAGQGQRAPSGESVEVPTPPRRVRSGPIPPVIGRHQIGKHTFASSGNLPFVAPGGGQKVPPSVFSGGGVFDKPFKTGKDTLRDVARLPAVHPTEAAA